MSPLNDFFDREKKRVFEPDAFFAKRVIARLESRNETNIRRVQDLDFWEAVPSSTRPVLAIALMLVLCFFVVEIFVPQVPQRGMVESFLAPEHSPAESFLYNDTDVPSQVVLQQLIEPED
jgi:hypothetical protein